MNKIGVNVVVSDGARLGDGVTLGNNVTVYPGVSLGDGCTVFDGAVLGRPPRTTGNTTRPLPPPGPLTIGAGSVVGANAVLYCGTMIGARVLIGDLATLREGCTVAADAVLGRGVMLYYDTVIGERTRIADGAILGGSMTVEADIFMGMGVKTVNDNRVYLSRFGLLPFEVRGPMVRRFALIGTGATLAGGTEVGVGAIVAPAAMVARDVPAWTVVAGVPARPTRVVDAAERDRLLRHFGLESLREAS